GDPMDDDRPLFSTFKRVGEDNTASAEPGRSTAPAQPRGAEQPPGHHETRSRVGRGAAKGPSQLAVPAPPSSPSRVLPGCGGSPPELAALRARTRLWFEQTQARRLGADGRLPAWFHGFISRRETEQLLQDQPQGCFLVRFSESTVGFVLSYRGEDRCRHFVLDQLPDGRYVILGEQSAHAELADLLRHYAAAPVTPYHEFLTAPRGRPQPPQIPAKPTSSPHLRPAPSLPQASGVPPPLPAKAGSLAAAQGPRSPAGGRAAPEGPYAQVHKAAVPPEPPAPPQPPDAKYQQLLCFHTYAEPHEGIAPSPAAHREPEEPIPFYAMGRGSSPSAEENIYAEV
ncbi:SH22A protein, partial [Steatornis caripensis]|nr:SH22A protein [Steatornis caripensis]